MEKALRFSKSWPVATLIYTERETRRFRFWGPGGHTVFDNLLNKTGVMEKALQFSKSWPEATLIY